MFDFGKIKSKVQGQLLELPGKHQEKVSRFSEALYNGLERVTPHKFKSYLKSHLFEDDLDQMIEFLNLHNNFKELKSFELIQDRKERLTVKGKHLRNQMGLFLSSMGALGVEFTTYVPAAGGAVSGFIVGTAVGLLIITVVAGVLIVKRITEAGDIIDVALA